MRKVLAAVTLSLLTGCGARCAVAAPVATPSTSSTSETDLIGRTVLFVYETATYRVEILDAEQLRWTRTRGDNTGETALERYVATVIGPEKVLVSWVEASGLALSNVLDPDAGTLLTHGNTGRALFRNPGRLEID